MSDGQFKVACPKLAESQRIDPAVGTLLYLAECYEKSGQTASAWATFELAAAEGRKDRQTEREQLAKARAEQLLPRLSRLVISVPESTKVQGLEITNDGEKVGSASWGTPLPMDPGKHVIKANAPGMKEWALEVNIVSDTTLTQVPVPALQPAEATSVPATAKAEPMAQPLPPATTAPAPATNQPESYWNTQRVLGVSLGGAGIASFGVGLALALSGQSKESDSEKYCAPNDPRRCTQQGVDMIDSAKGLNTAGNVLMGVGGALLVGGAAVFFTTPKHSEQSATATTPRNVLFVPSVAHNGAGLLLSGQF
jgi:serine/threonine-protein kinase